MCRVRNSEIATRQTASACQGAYSGRRPWLADFCGFRSSALARRPARHVGVQVRGLDADRAAEPDDWDLLEPGLAAPEGHRQPGQLGDLLDGQQALKQAQIPGRGGGVHGAGSGLARTGALPAFRHASAAAWRARARTNSRRAAVASGARTPPSRPAAVGTAPASVGSTNRGDSARRMGEPCRHDRPPFPRTGRKGRSRAQHNGAEISDFAL
jgi:hypothetical protein